MKDLAQRFPVIRQELGKRSDTSGVPQPLQ